MHKIIGVDGITTKSRLQQIPGVNPNSHLLLRDEKKIWLINMRNMTSKVIIIQEQQEMTKDLVFNISEKDLMIRVVDSVNDIILTYRCFRKRYHLPTE